MKAIVATGVVGATFIAVLIEVMNIALTFNAMQHVASYNAWMSL